MTQPLPRAIRAKGTGPHASAIDGAPLSRVADPGPPLLALFSDRALARRSLDSARLEAAQRLQRLVGNQAVQRRLLEGVVGGQWIARTHHDDDTCGKQQQSKRRQETGNRKDYWEDKVSAEAKQVCALLDQDWWDLMPHSSPHLTEGTGTGGQAGHEKRDGDMLQALHKAALELFAKKKGIAANWSWGQMLRHLKHKETKDDITERRDEEKQQERAANYAASAAASSSSSKYDPALHEKKQQERQEKKQHKQEQRDDAYDHYLRNIAFNKPNAEGWKEYERCCKDLCGKTLPEGQFPSTGQFDQWRNDQRKPDLGQHKKRK